MPSAAECRGVWNLSGDLVMSRSLVTLEEHINVEVGVEIRERKWCKQFLGDILTFAKGMKLSISHRKGEGLSETPRAWILCLLCPRHDARR